MKFQSDNQNGLKIEDLSFVYEAGTAMQSAALEHVSFDLTEGEFVGLIGHTGSGKSTLIQMLNGLMKPTSGNVYYNGEDIHADGFRKRDLRFNVGIVFQYPEHQLFEETVLKDVMFGPLNKGLSEEEAMERAKESLRMTGIEEEKFDASPFELSGGQKRRAAIAGVIAMQPKFLILDEPTAGLDPRGRDDILDMIRKMHDDLGITVVLVSHSMEDVAKYVHRILVMDHGHLVYDAPPAEVFKEYRTLETLGLSAPQVTYIMNHLKSVGLNVETDALTVDEAADEIMKLFEEGDLNA